MLLKYVGSNNFNFSFIDYKNQNYNKFVQCTGGRIVVARIELELQKKNGKGIRTGPCTCVKKIVGAAQWPIPQHRPNPKMGLTFSGKWQLSMERREYVIDD